MTRKGFAAGLVICLVILVLLSIVSGPRLAGAARVLATEPAPDAAASYNSHCAVCHGRDGRGKTRKGRQTHSRDLAGGEWQDSVSDERIYNSISNGKGKMPEVT